jgi:magnesium chelatase family protein
LEFPLDRITVNLAPAEVPEAGTGFDLPTALAILSATGIVEPDRFENMVALGELSLDGRIQPVLGVLPVALHCRRGVRRLLVPAGNAEEAAVVVGVAVIPVGTLHEALEYLNGGREIPAHRARIPCSALHRPSCPSMRAPSLPRRSTPSRCPPPCPG